ncbi:MAG: cob(I)yrinic acid a,c-diamide adenosyltransferase [Gammaproteobacteria bacterium]|nr:cob(I)yrinic acid a,c-diamide adenosyltransferase [Gammaproteobacteria bacterium]
MGHRLSKIYTRTGDKGMTGLAGGTRVDKDCARIEVIGVMDELNSHIGVILALDLPEAVRDCLTKVQHDLFDLGGMISMPESKHSIEENYITRLEKTLDSFNGDLPYLKEFILPGGGPAAAHCHVARTVCRRAERCLFTLKREEDVDENVLAYVNRLSDLLFVIARILARHESGSEVLWQPRSNR